MDEGAIGDIFDSAVAGLITGGRKKWEGRARASDHVNLLTSEKGRPIRTGREESKEENEGKERGRKETKGRETKEENKRRDKKKRLTRRS